MIEGDMPAGQALPEESAGVDRLGAIDYRGLPLKPDYKNRPIWVTPMGRIFLERFSPIFKQVRVLPKRTRAGACFSLPCVLPRLPWEPTTPPPVPLCLFVARAFEAGGSARPHPVVARSARRPRSFSSRWPSRSTGLSESTSTS